MKVRTLFGIAVIVTMTYGCGGGGGDTIFSGGGGGTSPFTITGSNAEDIAGAGLTLTLDSASNALDTTTYLLGVQEQTRKRHVNLVSFTQDQLQLLLDASDGRMLLPPNTVIAAITSKTTNCDSGTGSIVVSFEDADFSGDFTDGDSATITYSNCNLGTIHYEGAMTMANFMITGAGDPMAHTGAWNISTTVSVNNLAVTEGGFTDTINGSFDFTAQTSDNDTHTFTLDGTSLSDQYTGSTDTLQNFHFDVSFTGTTGAYTLAASGTLSSTGLGGTVTFSTPTTLAGTDPALPDTGEMKFEGDNSSVTATVLNATNVDLNIDLNGDGFTDTTINSDWATLTA